MKSTIYFLALLTSFISLFAIIPTQHSIKNSKGNIELYVSNNGIIANNQGQSGFIWPRGSVTQYIFGGGAIIFQYNPESEKSDQVPEFTYNYMTANGWFVPGSALDGDTLSPEMASKYRVYSSINYNHSTGKELFGGTGPNWAIWNGDDYIGENFGNYLLNEDDRDLSNSTPRFISDEDIVAIYKDTDKNFNTGALINPGLMPYGLDIQTRVYCFDDEEHKDVIFVNWIVTNRSDKELTNLTFAPVFDLDITKTTNAFKGTDNDIIIYPQDSSYVSFTTEMGDYEQGENFGFITFKWLETPAMSGNTVDYTSVDNMPLQTYIPRRIPPSYDLTMINNDFFKYGTPEDNKGEQKLLMPTHQFNLPVQKSASFAIQVNMTAPDTKYPQMDEEKRADIERELSSNEDWYDKHKTDVELAETSNDIKLYPNPSVDGMITVELSLPIGEQMSIEILDLSGKLLGILYQGLHYKQSYNLGIGKRSKGTYLLCFTIGTKQYSKKLVIGG